MNADLIVFKDEPSDKAYFEWMDANPNGYVAVPKLNSKSKDFKYHRSGCIHMADPSPNFSFTTKGKIKGCSNDLEVLKDWIKEHKHFNGVLNPCSSCIH